jgi:hypothetical protein
LVADEVVIVIFIPAPAVSTSTTFRI